MAELYHNREGRDLWRPTRVTLRGKKILLDPQLSPMENLSRLIDLQVSIWLAKYLVYSDSKEMVEQLEQDCKMAVFVELRRRVRLGQYDRTYSLYLNLRSCAWSVIGRTVKVWMLDVNRLANECSIYMEVGVADENNDRMVDIISYEEGRLNYRSKSEINIESKRRQRQRHNTRSLADPSINAKRREAMLKMMQKVRDAKEQQDEYDRYVSDCEFFGIADRLDYESFIKQNYK